MNMNGLPTDIPGLTRGNPEIIRLLEQALAAAKQGQLVGLGMVLVLGPEAMQSISAGLFPAAINTGCDVLKTQLLRNMMGEGKKSSILQLRQ